VRRRRRRRRRRDREVPRSTLIISCIGAIPLAKVGPGAYARG
jgi:hypothetical protein